MSTPLLNTGQLYIYKCMNFSIIINVHYMV